MPRRESEREREKAKQRNSAATRAQRDKLSKVVRFDVRRPENLLVARWFAVVAVAAAFFLAGRRLSKQKPVGRSVGCRTGQKRGVCAKCRRRRRRRRRLCLLLAGLTWPGNAAKSQKETHIHMHRKRTYTHTHTNQQAKSEKTKHSYRESSRRILSLVRFQSLWQQLASLSSGRRATTLRDRLKCSA